MQKRYLLGFVFFVGLFSAAPALAQSAGVKSPQNANKKNTNQQSAAVAPTNAPTKKIKHKKPRAWKPLTASEVSRLEYWQRVRYLRKLRERGLLVDKINREAFKLRAHIEQNKNKNKRAKKRKVAEASSAPKSSAWWELYILQPVADFLHARAWPMPGFLKAYVLVKETSAQQASSSSALPTNATILNCGEAVYDGYGDNASIGQRQGVGNACLKCDDNSKLFRCGFALTGLTGDAACVPEKEAGKRYGHQTFICLKKRKELQSRGASNTIVEKLRRHKYNFDCDLSDNQEGNSTLTKQMFDHAYDDRVMAYLVPYIAKCEKAEGTSKFKEALKKFLGYPDSKDYESVFIDSIAKDCTGTETHEDSYKACLLDDGASLADSLLARRGLETAEDNRGKIKAPGACSWKVPRDQLEAVQGCEYFAEELEQKQKCNAFFDDGGEFKTTYGKSTNVPFQVTPFAYQLCKDLTLEEIELDMARYTSSLGCVPPDDVQREGLEARGLVDKTGSRHHRWVYKGSTSDHALCVMCGVERAAIKHYNEEYEVSSGWLSLLNFISREGVCTPKAGSPYEFQTEYVQTLGFCKKSIYNPKADCEGFHGCFGIAEGDVKNLFCPQGKLLSIKDIKSTNDESRGFSVRDDLLACIREAKKNQEVLYEKNSGGSCMFSFNPEEHPSCNKKVFQSATERSGNFIYKKDACQVAWKKEPEIGNAEEVIFAQRKIESVDNTGMDTDAIKEGYKSYQFNLKASGPWHSVKFLRTFVGACNGGVPDSCTGDASASVSAEDNGSGISQ